MRLFQKTVNLLGAFFVAVTAPALSGAEVSWSVTATTVEGKNTYPDVPFQWTVTSSATEQYTTNGNVSDSITVSTSAKSFIGKATGNASLSHNIRKPWGMTLTLVITSSMGPSFSKVFEAGETNSVGTTPFPLIEGGGYWMYFLGTPPPNCSVTLSYSLTGIVQRTAYVATSAKGTGVVNAKTGPQSIPFNVVQAVPIHGGSFISTIQWNVSANDSRVTTFFTGDGTLTASTAYSKNERATNLIIFNGSRELSVADGPLILATRRPRFRFDSSAIFANGGR